MNILLETSLTILSCVLICIEDFNPKASSSMLFHGNSAHALLANFADNVRLIFSRSRRRERKTQHRISKPVERIISIHVEKYHCKTLDTIIEVSNSKPNLSATTNVPSSPYQDSPNCPAPHQTASESTMTLY